MNRREKETTGRRTKEGKKNQERRIKEVNRDPKR